MTFTEILKAKGLSDKDVESVIGEMKQNMIVTAQCKDRYKVLSIVPKAAIAYSGKGTVWFDLLDLTVKKLL